MPEIPLRIGSKLELLLRAFVVKFPYTSPYTHAFVRVCILILPCIYVYISYNTMYMTEAPRVLHLGLVRCRMNAASGCGSYRHVIDRICAYVPRTNVYTVAIWS